MEGEKRKKRHSQQGLQAGFFSSQPLASLALLASDAGRLPLPPCRVLQALEAFEALRGHEARAGLVAEEIRWLLAGLAASVPHIRSDGRRQPLRMAQQLSRRLVRTLAEGVQA